MELRLAEELLEVGISAVVEVASVVELFLLFIFADFFALLLARFTLLERFRPELEVPPLEVVVVVVAEAAVNEVLDFKHKCTRVTSRPGAARYFVSV